MMKASFGNSSASSLRVSLFGVGGAGSNVLRVLNVAGQDGETVYSVNSDARLLAESQAPCKIKLGEGVTYGLGAGGDPALGEKMARESEASFIRAFESCDVAVFVAGLGGGTGSGSLPVMAKLAREMGVFLVSVVAMPFEFEGSRRRDQAEASLESISLYSDIVMVFENDWMGTLLQEGGLAHDAFEAANRLMGRAVSFIPRLVRSPGLLHLGLDDLKAAVSGRGNRCLFGCGTGTGDASGICSAVFDSPLLKQGGGILPGSDVLAHVSGGRELTFARVQEIFLELANRLPDGVQTHVGVAVSESNEESVEVVVFASMGGMPRISSANSAKTPVTAVTEKKEEIRETPPVQIITVPVDPVDESPSGDAPVQEDDLEEDTYVVPEMKEDHLILEPRIIDEDSCDEPAPEPLPSPTAPPPAKSRPSPAVSASGKGRFDGDSPFLVDGEDLDLPPSMRRKN